MRKYVSLVMAILLLAALAVPVSAAPAAEAKAPQYVTYKLDELPIAISLPDNYDVFQMSTKPDDPLFKKHGRDSVKMLEWMVKYNIFMNALSADGKSEFLLDINTDEEFAKEEDFYEVDEEYLMNTAELSAKEMEKQGTKVLDYGSFMSSQLNYVYLVYDNAEGHCVRLYTLSNIDEDPAFISLNYTSQDAISEETLEMVFTVAENLNITLYPIYYWDDVNGVTFIAPEGCYANPMFIEEKEILYSLRLPEGSFGYFNYYAEEAKGAPDINDMTLEEACKEMGINAKDVEGVTYNGQNFLAAKVTEDLTVDGKPAKVDTINLITFGNDGLYHIQYIENQADKNVNMDAVEDLLDTIEFGVTED